MYDTILTFIKFINFGTQRLNSPKHLFLSFYCTTWCVFEPLYVYDRGINTDKYSKLEA